MEKFVNRFYKGIVLDGWAARALLRGRLNHDNAKYTNADKMPEMLE
jgi:hypothetical protein